MKTARVGVGGIVLNEQSEVLMVKRGNSAPRFPGAWTIPTGMVDSGEDRLDALRREMQEELGLLFEPAHEPVHTGMKKGVSIHYFLGSWVPEDKDQGIVLKPSPKGVIENDEYAFVPLAEAIRRGEQYGFVFVDALKLLQS